MHAWGGKFSIGEPGMEVRDGWRVGRPQVVWGKGLRYWALACYLESEWPEEIDSKSDQHWVSGLGSSWYKMIA